MLQYNSRTVHYVSAFFGLIILYIFQLNKKVDRRPAAEELGIFSYFLKTYLKR